MINTSPLTREFWESGKCAACPVYDMHGHMGTSFAGIYFPNPEPEQMIRSMDGAGVRMLLFSHHEALMAPDIGNAPAIEAVRRFPDRLRAYLVVNPHYAATAEKEIAAYDDFRDVYVGFKFLSDYHKAPLSHSGYQAAWEYAQSRELFVLAHTWSESPFDGPEEVDRCAGKYDKVKFFLGHSLHDDWDAAVRIAREHPNVFLELTAVLDNRGPIEKFVSEVGSQRLLFGTDLPWFSPHQGIGALLSADISDEDRHNILHGNAERLLAEHPDFGPAKEMLRHEHD